MILHRKGLMNHPEKWKEAGFLPVEQFSWWRQIIRPGLTFQGHLSCRFHARSVNQCCTASLHRMVQRTSLPRWHLKLKARPARRHRLGVCEGAPQTDKKKQKKTDPIDDADVINLDSAQNKHNIQIKPMFINCVSSVCVEQMGICQRA